MYPYSSSPHSRDRLSFALCISSAALSLAAFYLAAILPSFRGPAQLLGFAFLVAATYLLARNRIPMTYSICPTDDQSSADLVIARNKGKHTITVCRLSIRDIREIDIANRHNHSQIKKKYQSDTIHNYCPSLFPEQSAYLRFADSDPHLPPSATEEERLSTATRIVIRIACDDTILSLLQRELNRN